MLKRDKDWEKVEAYRKKHPDASLTAACKMSKVNYSSYYAANKAKHPQPTKPRYQKIKAAPAMASVATRSGVRCVVIQGTADEVRETLRGLQ